MIHVELQPRRVRHGYGRARRVRTPWGGAAGISKETSPECAGFWSASNPRAATYRAPFHPGAPGPEKRQSSLGHGRSRQRSHETYGSCNPAPSNAPPRRLERMRRSELAREHFLFWSPSRPCRQTGGHLTNRSCDLLFHFPVISPSSPTPGDGWQDRVDAPQRRKDP